tara:strand:- start:11567 stop:12214 length:648 start_codon:yes stop_codon:yes gene_type:complete
MNKKFKKSDINKYLKRKKLKKGLINELIDTNGSLIKQNNNYKQSVNFIKSKKTTDDFVRNSTQGPEAYFIYGGPYYGVNYTYIVNEEDDLLDGDNLEEEKDDNLYSEGKDNMKSLVDEIIRNKKNNVGMVKRRNEQDIMVDKVEIPDISELKTVYEKPMVIRKLNVLLDIINKENIKGEELTILLNHLLDNVDIYSINDEGRELLGDKIKYEEEQ